MPYLAEISRSNPTAILFLVTYFSRRGIKQRGIIPPRTIPTTIDLMWGSMRLAIRSAIICDKAAPIIPAI